MKLGIFYCFPSRSPIRLLLFLRLPFPPFCLVRFTPVGTVTLLSTASAPQQAASLEFLPFSFQQQNMAPLTPRDKSRAIHAPPPSQALPPTSGHDGEEEPAPREALWPSAGGGGGVAPPFPSARLRLFLETRSLQFFFLPGWDLARERHEFLPGGVDVGLRFFFFFFLNANGGGAQKKSRRGGSEPLSPKQRASQHCRGAPSVGLFAFISTEFRCKASKGTLKRGVNVCVWGGWVEEEEEEGNGRRLLSGALVVPPASSLLLCRSTGRVCAPRARVGWRASCKESSANPEAL